MGVRVRVELKQALQLNMSSHERKRAIMYKISNTKATHPKEGALDKPYQVDKKNLKLPLAKDPEATATLQMTYPLLKPIAFTNEIEDDYLAAGVWNLKK